MDLGARKVKRYGLLKISYIYIYITGFIYRIHPTITIALKLFLEKNNRALAKILKRQNLCFISFFILLQVKLQMLFHDSKQLCLSSNVLAFFHDVTTSRDCFAGDSPNSSKVMSKFCHDTNHRPLDL